MIINARMRQQKVQYMRRGTQRQSIRMVGSQYGAHVDGEVLFIRHRRQEGERQSFGSRRHAGPRA